MLFVLINLKGINYMNNKNRKVDWLIIIPIIFLFFCTILSIGKMFQLGSGIHIIECVNILNENTFSTFISMVICMSYKFFSADEKREQENSGLSRKWIWLTITLTLVYMGLAIVNSCRYCWITVIIMAIMSIAYIITFFKFMRVKE